MSEKRQRGKGNDDLHFLEPGRPVAVLVDGGFFHKRYKAVFSPGPSLKWTAEEAVNNLYTMALRHVEGHTLYRIFYYDCMPLSKRVHNPVSHKAINFQDSNQYRLPLKMLCITSNP